MLTKIFKSILRILCQQKRKEGCGDDEKRCDALLYEAMDSEESEYSNSESNPSLTEFMQRINKPYLFAKLYSNQHEKRSFAFIEVQGAPMKNPVLKLISV